MNNNINVPERGNKIGVYECVDVNGETKQMVAANFPQADALTRQNWTYVGSVQEVEKQKANQLKAEKPAKK